MESGFKILEEKKNISTLLFEPKLDFVSLKFE